MYAQHDYDFVQRADLLVTSEDAGIESIFIEITLPNNNGQKAIVGRVYRSETDTNYFNEALANTLDQITKEGKMCYILGDFNINLFKSDTHPHRIF